MTLSTERLEQESEQTRRELAETLELMGLSASMAHAAQATLAGLAERNRADEFPEGRTLDELARFIEKRLGEIFGEPFRVNDNELRISARVGIAIYPADGSDADTLRPSLFTSSGRDGTSASWQIRPNDFVPGGTSLQRRSGFIFSESLTCEPGSITQNARSPGIRPPSAKAVLVSRIAGRLRLLPMRRRGLVEVRQRFHPRLPGLERRRQQPVGIEVG